MTLTPRLLRRLWRNTVVDPTTGCWTWTAKTNHAGYGQTNVGGRTVSVHRLALVLQGNEPDDELTADHVCRNRACWNPAHLQLVTLRENILRGTSPTAVNAAKTECVNGHPFNEENTRWRNRPGRNRERECRQCRRDAKRRARSTP